MYSLGRNSPRNPPVTSPGMSQQTRIIVIVCASVGGIFFLFVLFSLFRRIRKPEPAPLPPIQPLAHHREQQLAKNESRTTVWYDPAYLSVPPHPLSTSSRGSKMFLLGPEISSSNIPSRHASLNISETTSEDLSMSTTPLEPEPSLPLPHPSFHPLGGSSSSLGSNDTDAPPSPSPSITPVSAIESPLPLDTASVQPFIAIARQSRSASTSHSQRRPRPLSVGSTASSAFSRTSRSTIRGVPHGPHSNVQIILPAPLATGPHHQDGRQLSHYSPSQSRLSVVDQWASAAVSSSESVDAVPRKQRRSLSSEDRFASTSWRVSSPTAHSRSPRRVASTSSYASSSLDHTSQHLQGSYHSFPPPVPRIPSIYGNVNSIYSDDVTTIQEEVDRGRSRFPSPLQIPEQPEPVGLLGGMDSEGGMPVSTRQREQSEPTPSKSKSSKLTKAGSRSRSRSAR